MMSIDTDDVQFSIIVPAYNAESTIDRCISSVRNQTLESWEIIVVDDGSTDSTAEIVSEFCVRDCRIKLVSQRNSGRSVARNLGIQTARGKWIVFLDSDDYLYPESLNIYMQGLEYSEVVWTGYKSSSLCFGVSGRQSILSPCEVLMAMVDPRSFAKTHEGCSIEEGVITKSVWGGAYSRSLLINNNIFFSDGLVYGEDSLFNCQILKKTNHVTFIPKVTYYYDIDDSSTCNKFQYDDYIYLIRYSDAIIKESFSANSILLEQDAKSLIARECLTMIRRAAHNNLIDDSTLLSIKNAIQYPLIRDSLTELRSRSFMRLILWPFELFLLKKSFIRAVILIEKINS